MNEFIKYRSNGFFPVSDSLFDRLSSLMFKDFFDTNSYFQPITTIEKISYPINVKQFDSGIELEFAAVGINKEDIKIECEDDNIVISHDSKSDLRNANTEEDLNKWKEDNGHYVYHGITQKSFKHSWKLNDTFDSSKIEASLDKGLLIIKIPYKTEIKEKKELKIIAVK